VRRHTRSEILTARRRYIRRRLRMCRWWGWEVLPEPGRLAKWNLVCTCRMCRYWRPKYRDGRMREKVRWRREAWAG